MPGWFINCGAFFAKAKAASESIALQSPGDQNRTDNDAIVAVLLAVASLEGFINELADMASVFRGDPRLAMLAEIVQDLEEDGASLRTKFRIAKWILTSEPYDEGKRPYQDFKTLLALRNALVHLKSEKFDFDRETGSVATDKAPPFLRDLEAKKLLRVITTSPSARAPWVARVSTSAVALWSCDTAKAMAQSLIDVLPNLIRLPFAKAFTLDPALSIKANLT